MSSRHNELGRAGAILSALSNALGASANIEGVTRLSETLHPVVDIWSQGEWAFLRNERLCAGFATAAIDVANFSNVQLFNPADSGAIIVVDHIEVTSGNVGGYTVDETTTAIGAVVTGQSSVRDSRWRSANVLGVLRQGATAAPVGIPMIFYRINATIQTYPIPGPFVLQPGSSIYVRGAAINLGVSGSFWWRERIAYPTEDVD